MNRLAVFKSFVLLATVAAAASGCGGPAFVMRSEFIDFTPEQRIEMQSRNHTAYRIQEGDILAIRFAYEKNLNQDGVIVLPDGSVNLIGVDRIPVAGLTVSEADSLLTRSYAREYREPDLSILFQETTGRRVYVLGEVRNPGMYRLPMGGTDIMSAISLAAGFSENAARDGTLVMRMSDSGYQIREVNLDQFGTTQFGNIAAVQLQSYDIVYVPRSRAGDLAYFAKSVLSSIGYATRIVYDLKFIGDGTLGRY
ncbi:MAG: polysaccharide export protein [bacterium]|nr:polysaccharide export protein [bacterium]